MKKYVIPVLVLLVVLLAGGYAYVQWASKQAPKDVYVATNDGNNSGNNVEESTSTEGNNIYAVAANSVLGWKATKPTGFHTGTVDIINGDISVQDGNIVSGNFVFDLSTITLLDIDNPKLLEEIKRDFYEIERFPTSTFVLKKVYTKGDTTFMEGDLTIKDQTNPISFPVELSSTGDTINGKAQFAIDRHSRGLNAMEGLVNDFLEFNFDLTWNKMQ